MNDLRYGRMKNGKKYYCYVKWPYDIPISHHDNENMKRIKQKMYEIVSLMMNEEENG